MTAKTSIAVLLGVAASGLAAPLVNAEEAAPSSPVYGKPFLTKGGASVGGYIDIEFKADGDGSTFDQHRFVPFIYAAVSDRVHVASEIEFEHGGFVSGDDETDGEIKIEFATVDITASEALNFRGGVILSPLGRLNAYHDAPMLDLTDRPLVTRHIIPTTLSESGLGVFGTVYPSEATVLTYEAYLVNGFGDNAVRDGVLNIRGARGSKKSDNNNGRAIVGRAGFSPRLGTEIGASVHTGDYDDMGEHNLTILALDAIVSTGAFEILGEGAMARGSHAGEDAGEDAAKALGFYVEGRYHFLPGAVRGLDESVFTGVVRADHVDRDTNVDGADVQRLTLGLNFRITEETVIKNDVLFDRTRGAGITEWGDTETGYRLSIASYF